YALPMQGIAPKEGSCHNDVTCYSAYAQEASGVARMSFVEGGNTFTCTGCLIQGNDSSPYFLTADHCIDSQTLASTIEFYWFFQTRSCNGSPPSLSSVPHTTGGADLLATSTANDLYILRLCQKPHSNSKLI